MSKIQDARDILDQAARGGDASFVSTHLLGWAHIVQDHLEHPGKKRYVEEDVEDDQKDDSE